MKAVIFAVICLSALAVAEESCYKDINQACKATNNKQNIYTTPKCNATYGAISAVLPDLRNYATQHITHSFEYLLLATHYGNYEKNREGFRKVFQDLSDEKWKSSIELIKYIAKRGGDMDWTQNIIPADMPYDIYELPALAKALDIEKELAIEAHRIHRETTRKREEYHDPEISDHIEHEYSHKQRDNIRKLAGYVSDLTKILDGPDSSLGLYLFDEYLQKQ